MRWLYTSIGMAALLAGACSLVLEADKAQCAADEDCVIPYVCGGAGFCEEAACDDDSDCRLSGICLENVCAAAECLQTEDCAADELCNTATSRCVTASLASCDSAEDCAVYDGAPVCTQADSVCREFECTRAEDCGTSPTVSCEMGACVDAQWGCLGQPLAPLPDNASSIGSLEVPVIYFFPSPGETETAVSDLDVRVCQFNDASCSVLVSEDWTYEGTQLTIRGLENSKNYRIRLFARTPDGSEELMETEYFMYRTIRGETVDPEPIIMATTAIRDMLAGLVDARIDDNLGLLLAYTLDCQQAEIEGVSIATDKPTVGCGGDQACATTTFYFTSGNLPDPGATQTSLAGRLGVANMEANSLNRLTLTRVADDERITSFIITPRPGVLSYSFFYPNDFGTSAD